ncbi:MAG: hypothetical protein ACRD1U_13705 [Vicinamibacterales bacterium]
MIQPATPPEQARGEHERSAPLPEEETYERDMPDRRRRDER